MTIRTLCLALVCLAAGLGSAHAENLFERLEQTSTAEPAQDGSERLLIVNGSTHQVLYDDGKTDLFCVVRKVRVGYDADGDPIYRRKMRCR